MTNSWGDVLEDRVVIAFNRSKNQALMNPNVSPELADGDYVEALSGIKVAVKDGKLEFAVAPQAAAFVTKP